MAAESESIRTEMDYMDHPAVETVLTSFFLHVYFANSGKFGKSTLLLREAIACAHILGLHKDAFYEGMESSSVQYHLRLAWLLYITDKAHSIQNDIPATFKLSPTLPELTPEGNLALLRGFCTLCKLFRSFDEVDPIALKAQHAEALEAIRSQLSQSHLLPRFSNDIQRADLLVTEPWLRIVLWKKVIPYVDLTVEPTGKGVSISFPTIIANDLVSRLSTVSKDALEAHGPGMRSKLFEIASALADVITCVPGLTELEPVNNGPRDVLRRLAASIASLRGPGSPTLLTILQEKMIMCGLDHPGPSRVLDITEDVDVVQLEQPNNGRDCGATSSCGGSTQIRYDIRTSPIPEQFRTSYEIPETLLDLANSPKLRDFRSDLLQRPETLLSDPTGIREDSTVEHFTSSRDGHDLSAPRVFLDPLGRNIMEQYQSSLQNYWI
ncbi:Sucrose utilization protein suc1 [Pleurostoma richardsiae]|uniref:Sucrose utilization protein suc1 n=1 Tax=Pleurostoma richardsiae TaxID=41990 RepID=A0AA38RIF4_9PEZI|nr:Sucrose utilization protein suc1 [Pleurostoma richardsiae]